MRNLLISNKKLSYFLKKVIIFNSFNLREFILVTFSMVLL